MCRGREAGRDSRTGESMHWGYSGRLLDWTYESENYSAPGLLHLMSDRYMKALPSLTHFMNQILFGPQECPTRKGQPCTCCPSPHCEPLSPGTTS